MKREIKFRAWRTTWDKKMLHVSRLWMPEDERCLGATNEDETIGIKTATADEYELMQFTGLKDKNGTELYEGDIVDVRGYKSAICCENSYVSFYFWNEITHEFVGLAFLLGYKNFEIVGNIYENPELLEPEAA